VHLQLYETQTENIEGFLKFEKKSFYIYPGRKCTEKIGVCGVGVLAGVVEGFFVDEGFFEWFLVLEQLVEFVAEELYF